MPACRMVRLSLAALLLPWGGLAQTPVTFFQPVNFGTCNYEAAADFNHDGNLDVACAGNTLTIWLGDGQGHFRQSAALAYVATPIVAGDFNGDGKPDLVVSDRDQVLLLPGRGDGTFGAPSTIAVMQSNMLAAGDLNGDGNLDLLVSSIIPINSSGPVDAFLGNGDGTFQLPIATGISASLNVVVADFNNDGIPDMASVAAGIDNSTPTLEVGLGKGDGTFQPQVDTVITNGYVASRFVVAHFTGGKFPDVAYSDDTNLYVLIGNGDGTFSPGPVSSGRQVVLAADLNGDGKPDLVTGGGSVIAVVLNQGGGVFGPEVYYQNQYGAGGVAGDFRHMGTPDVVVAGDFYPNDGSGHFHAPRSYPVGNCNDCWHLVAGDFNNDGNLDAAVLLGGPIEVYLGNGHGRYNGYKQTNYNFLDRESIVAAAAADFNGDGKLDLALGTANNIRGKGEAVVVLGNGDGTFGPLQVFYTGGPVAVIVTADFNQDGKMDAAIATAGGVLVFLGNGAGGFTQSASLDTFNGLVVADFNGDGIPDVASTADVYLGNGDGTFRHTFSTNQTGSIALAADFTGDGKVDLVVADTSPQGSLTLWPGDGDGTFGTPISIVSNASFLGPVVAADLNGDGSPDIAASTTMFFLNRGNGTFTQQNMSTLPQPSIDSNMVAADFNHDGKVDLLLVSSTQLMTLLNTTK